MKSNQNQNVLTRIYYKLIYLSFIQLSLLKRICHVFKYIHNYMVVIMNLHFFCTFKIYELIVILNHITVKIILYMYFMCFSMLVFRASKM